MPHIRVMFLEEDLVIKPIIRENKRALRTIVSECTGYPLEDIALVPEMISRELAALSDNLLPLEIVIDCGIKTQNREEEIAHLIQSKLLEIEAFQKIKFGIWLRTMIHNSFVLHKV